MGEMRRIKFWLIAAIAILAIGILSILTLFPVGIDSSKKAAVRTKAAILGEMKIEDLKAETDFASMASIPKRNFSVTEDPEQLYQFKVDVSGVALKTDGSVDKLKRVIVTVYWPSKEADESKQQQMVFTTLVGNR